MEPADTTLVMEAYGPNCGPMKGEASFICLAILLAGQTCILNERVPRVIELSS